MTAITKELDKRYIRSIAKNSYESYYINIPIEIIKKQKLRPKQYLQIHTDQNEVIYMKKVDLK